MNAWERFIRALISNGETPKMFCLMHIIALIFIIGCSIAVVLLRKKINDKIYKTIILSVWIVLLILELFKQITFSSHISKNNVLFYSYSWLVFPFQFCSSPYYLLPLIVFLKDGIIKKRIELFSSIFMLLGGLLGSFIPAFTSIIWTNYHTLIFHGIMIVIPIMIAIKNKDQFTLKNFLESTIIFFAFVLIALLLNAIIPACNKQAIQDGFNMFYLSWHFAPGVIVLKQLWEALPYPVYLFLYIIGFILCCFLFYIIYSFLLNHKVDLTIDFIKRKKRIHHE